MVGGRETGNETYVKGLVEGFQDLPGVELVVYHVGAPWVAPRLGRSLRRLRTANSYIRLGVELPARSMADRLQVLHMTYAAPLWSPARIVLTVHDVCFVTNPEWFSARDLRVLNNVVPRSIGKAAHVITVSESARRQIIEAYGVPDEKISVIPNGPGPGARPLAESAAREALVTLGVDPNRRFILAVGNLQPRKNLGRLIEAFSGIATQVPDLDLVVVGPEHYRADEVFASASAFPDRVRLTGYVTDEQLAACYSSSLCFVFPSLYEGFGLPAIEAMAHGAPVVSSSTGALPEVCGDAALYFDPRSVEEMRTALLRIATDTGLRERLGAAGSERARRYTWRHSAELTLAVYAKVMG